MTQGRTPNPDEAIDRLAGEAPEKERLKVILEQVGGDCSVEEACERLGVSRSRYFELRQQALQGALEGLEPGAAGRPRTVDEIDPDDVDALVERVWELDREKKIAEARIDLAMEGVPVRAPKKTDEPITTAKRKLRKEQRKSRQRNRRK